MYGLQEHEMRFYCLFKKVYFSLLATSDFFCRHAYAYAHMRIIRHESDMAAYAWPSLVRTVRTCPCYFFSCAVLIFKTCAISTVLKVLCYMHFLISTMLLELCCNNCAVKTVLVLYALFYNHCAITTLLLAQLCFKVPC